MGCGGTSLLHTRWTAVPQHRQLVNDLDPKPVHVGFVVDKVAMRQVSLGVFGF
jgi:hypothetical protein